MPVPSDSASDYGPSPIMRRTEQEFLYRSQPVQHVPAEFVIREGIPGRSPSSLPQRRLATFHARISPMGWTCGELNSFSLAPWSLCKRSSTSSPVTPILKEVEKGKREKDRFGPPHCGTGRPSALGYLNSIRGSVGH